MAGGVVRELRAKGIAQRDAAAVPGQVVPAVEEEGALAVDEHGDRIGKGRRVNLDLFFEMHPISPHEVKIGQCVPLIF